MDIIVVDYGSDAEYLADVQAQCAEFGATCISVPGVSKWNRAHCLNVGIRAAVAQFVLLADVDVIFPPSYVRCAVAEAMRYPLDRFCGYMRDLPESMEGFALPSDVETYPAEYDQLAGQAEVRGTYGTHGSILLVDRRLLTWMGGLDEMFEEWGFEDLDLITRLIRVGNKCRTWRGWNFYLHQWHEQYAGVRSDSLKAKIQENRQYYMSQKDIVRNQGRWGRVDIPAKRTGES